MCRSKLAHRWCQRQCRRQGAKAGFRAQTGSSGRRGRTSTVSKTLMTPGCRSVRSFFKEFLASGSRALLAGISKEKMLQLEPSSWIRGRARGAGSHVRGRRAVLGRAAGSEAQTHATRAVVESPDGLAQVHTVPEGVRERGPFGDGRGHGRLKKIHIPRARGGEKRWTGGLKGSVSVDYSRAGGDATRACRQRTATPHVRISKGSNRNDSRTDGVMTI